MNSITASENHTHQLLTIILTRIYISVMYVCLCKGVTDRDIEREVFRGANSFRDVRDALGVATQCGKCARLTRAIVKQTLREASPPIDAYNAALA